MDLLYALVFISGFCFIVAGISYFISTKMKSEFRRFGFEKAGAFTAVLELLGASGLLMGLKVHPILAFSAGGLTILMLLAVAIRIKVGDAVRLTLPALFLMILNANIFYLSLHLF